MSELNPSAPLRANRPEVIDETFEGEAVLVNLESGCYYALTPEGTSVWNLISEGRSLDSLLASTTGESDGVREFVAALLEEALLVEGEADLGPAAEQTALDAAPKFERFTDMQDLLLLDPIHDINLDADGWPVAPGS